MLTSCVCPSFTCRAELDGHGSCFQGGTSDNKAVLGPRQEEASKGCYQRGEAHVPRGTLCMLLRDKPGTRGELSQYSEGEEDVVGRAEASLGHLLEFSPRAVVLSLWSRDIGYPAHHQRGRISPVYITVRKSIETAVMKWRQNNFIIGGHHNMKNYSRVAA